MINFLESKIWGMAIFIIISGILFLLRIDGLSQEKSSIQIETKSAVLIDGETGAVLFSQNPTERIAPASLTKIMTTYLAYEALAKKEISLNDQVTISQKAWKMGGSQMFIEVGKKVSVYDLLRGMAVVSGNDASFALAEHIAGLEEAFVERMNQKVKDLGLINTNFVNPHGLPAKNEYSTAMDMALLVKDLIKRFPKVLELSSIKEYEFGGIKQRNRNGLLFQDLRVDGLKTGWIKDSGYHLVATAKEKERHLIAVIMGAKNEKIREAEALRLLNYGFRNFSTLVLFEQEKPVTKMKVWRGKTSEVAVIPDSPGKITVRKGMEGKVTEKNIFFVKELKAPVKMGTKVGEATIFYGGNVYIKASLIVAKDIPAGSFLKRFMDSLLLLFR